MSYAERERHNELIGVLKGIEKQLDRIADALEKANEPEVMELKAPRLYVPKSYRQVLAQLAPENVGNWKGGAKGCPGVYFKGAMEARYCGPATVKDCYECWSSNYQEEEFIYKEEQS